MLQTDGYQAYDGVGGPKLVHIGCWAHARRKFVDAVKVQPQDGDAIKMVVRMDALFLVDREARQQGMTAAERLAFRREHAREWVDEIQQACRALSKQVLPQSALGKAATYTLNMWTKLERCFEYDEVELSNNLAEKSMWPVALGRKNWLHVGSVKAGPKVAAIRPGLTGAGLLMEVARKPAGAAASVDQMYASATLTAGLTADL